LSLPAAAMAEWELALSSMMVV